MQSFIGKIISRIYGHGRGWAFSRSDFLDIAGRSTVESALTRLHKKGTIRRVLPGVYDYPRHSDLLGEDLMPDVGRVAEALAREHRWHIVPGGPTALHALGLSDQVPAQYRYLSSGPNRSFDVKGTTLTFLHRKTQHTVLSDERAALLVQALNAIGDGKLKPSEQAHLAALFKPSELRSIVRETTSATARVHAYIKEIANLAQTRETAP